MPNIRRKVRLEAMYDLRAIGWSCDNIALALTISRATVERLTEAPLDPNPGRRPITTMNTCCYFHKGNYCNKIVPTLGEVFCDDHRLLGWRRPKKGRDHI